MRVHCDFLPGERLTFEEIARRYALRYPQEKALTASGLLSPSTVSHQPLIRAVFAHREFLCPLEELLFISRDNARKNYLMRFEHYLQTGGTFFYFRRHGAASGQWKVMGECRVLALIDPSDSAAQRCVTSRGYQLVALSERDGQRLWQLYDAAQQPCFNRPRPLDFIVILTGAELPPARGVLPGAALDAQARGRIWQRMHEAHFQQRVIGRYGACVVTGTPRLADPPWPWLEVCYIDGRPGEPGRVADTDADNGLLLRSDLRQLFELRLLGIDADSGTVRFRRLNAAEAQLGEAYREIDGRVCRLWTQVPAASRARLKRRG
ncbi:HNH endonuclease signature motif containing protein [Pantoea sp. 1.19]|uniref:HNH endonuclease signature motif containing protein n=1 Tax=Pantoea sp. 1.19 TaxID=1925589 RepID=UPI00094905F5|nr:HNH endonuclease signature motif containing protein [Pantoea sp. 1.19]